MKVHIIGGGTLFHVRPHLTLGSRAYGKFACDLAQRFLSVLDPEDNIAVKLHLSRPALGTLLDYPNLVPLVDRESSFETNDDLRDLLDAIVADPERSIVFMTAAVCDFYGEIADDPASGAHMRGTPSGKDQPRLKTAKGEYAMILTPSEKLIDRIRSKRAPNPRKDIFLVGCKTTTGATDDEMFLAGLKLLKDASCNLVLVNDIHRRQNMVVTPEQARYGCTSSRSVIAELLMGMALTRSEGTFTRSTVVPGEPVAWTDERVHPTLRAVVDHCIEKGAYKDLLGRNATVGHFAQKLDSDRFLTSRRNANFNKMAEVGLVEVEADGDERVIAHGFRPSVGGQSQRIIFREHPDTDCIVHFHCPPKPGVQLPKRSQWANECGSHQCGQNTSNGLVEIEPGIKVVYLDKHGPNIVFHHSIDPERVISFIDRHFDLSRHTGEALPA